MCSEGWGKILSQQIYIYFSRICSPRFKGERDNPVDLFISVTENVFQECVVLAVELLIIFLVCVVTASERGQLDNTAK